MFGCFLSCLPNNFPTWKFGTLHYGTIAIVSSELKVSRRAIKKRQKNETQVVKFLSIQSQNFTTLFSLLLIRSNMFMFTILLMNFYCFFSSFGVELTVVISTTQPLVYLVLSQRREGNSKLLQFYRQLFFVLHNVHEWNFENGENFVLRLCRVALDLPQMYRSNNKQDMTWKQ